MKAAGSGILAMLALAASCTAMAADSELNVYNWSDYIGPNTVSNFSKETQIHVRYDVFDSDDTLQAKLLTGKAGYDVVYPSANYMAKQIEAGIYLKLDRARLSNWHNLSPTLLKMLESIDPGNRYGVPYAWTTTGMGLNIGQLQKELGKDAPLNNWDLLLKPELVSRIKCGVSMLDSPNDAFEVTLKYLGKNPSSSSPADYQAAYEQLRKIRPYITQFSSSGYINDLANGDVCLAMGWSGDVNIAMHRSREAHKSYDLRYVAVKDNTPLGFSMMAIPRDAAHIDAAYKWINYILKPEVHADITNTVYYPNGNQASEKYIRPEILADKSVFPPMEQVRAMYMQKPLPSEINRLMNRLWVSFKNGR